jgi:WD40 repeat protein
VAAFGYVSETRARERAALVDSGRYLIFSRGWMGAEGLAPLGLYVMDLKSGAVGRLFAEWEGTLPAQLTFDPEGRRLAWPMYDGIRIWDPDTDEVTLLAMDRVGRGPWVTWSPDGNQLLAPVFGSGRRGLALLDASARPWQSPFDGWVTGDPEHQMPAWRPGDDMVMVTRGDRLGLVDVTTGAAQPIALHGAEDLHLSAPAWSPDGSQVAVRVPYGPKHGVYVIESTNRAVERIVTARVTASLCWSPDGRWITYSDAGSLRAVEADSGKRITLTSGPGAGHGPYDFAPAWTEADLGAHLGLAR